MANRQADPGRSARRVSLFAERKATMRLCPGLFVLLCVLAQAAAAAQGPGIPFHETFPGGRSTVDWRTHVSPGNEVLLRDGRAEIRARLNTYAYLSHPLQRDCVTVSARVLPSPDAGVTWATSVFLLWNDRNWCQIGVASHDGGCYYAVETEDGASTETKLGSADPKRWHYVRIQLGRTVVRYQASVNGSSWSTLRSIGRPVPFVGRLALVAVGKGYGRGQAPYGKPGLQNDYADPGPRVTSMVADIRAQDTPAGSLTLTAAEAAAARRELEDPVAAVELARRGDPTYERVARHYPPMRHPKEILGVPGHANAFALDEVGRLLPVDGAKGETRPAFWLELGEPSVPLASDARRLTRSLVDRHLPIVTLSGTVGGQRVEQTAFGWSDALSPHRPLFAYVRLRVWPRSGQVPPQSAWWTALPGPGRTRISLRPAAGGYAEVCMRAPWDGPGAAEGISSQEYTARLAEARRLWRGILAQGMQVDTPDPRVNDAWRAWMAWSLLNTHLKDGYFEAHDGTGFYDLIYGYSAALYCHALDLYGRHDRARSLIGTMLHYQGPDGHYMQNFGLPDQGALMFAIAEHYRLTGDRAWLRTVAPALVRAGDWVLAQRAGASRTGIAAGLLVLPPYCDYQTPTVDYFGDTYCWMGLTQAASVLPDAGRSADARRFGAEAARYRTDILRSMDASIFSRGGVTYLPIEPTTRRLEKESGYRGGEYYGLVASCMLESGALGPTDRRTLRVTDLMADRGGLIAGNCRFSGGIDHAYTYGYLQNCLQRGLIERYLLGFYGMLAYGMTRDTFSGVEVTMLKTGDNAGTLPHLYSCTQQLRTLRMMLLREDGDTLRIGEAIPRAWLAPGKRLVVRSASTRFGDITYTAESAARSVRLRITPRWRTPPARIVVRLRTPAGRLRSVRVDGRPWAGFRREDISLPAAQGSHTIVASY